MYITVLCTVNTQESADEIASSLVEEKLAACVNILNGITSVYRWKDSVAKDKEILMLIKTKKSLFPKLQERITQLHPYEVPEIIALDIAEGAKPYLNWLNENTI